MTFFHGIQISETLSGGVPISTSSAAVLGLVGYGTQWAVPKSAAQQPPGSEKLVLVNSTAGINSFGPMIQGFSIPYALEHISMQAGSSGIGQILVVDVFNPAVHNTAVANQSLTVPSSGLLYVNTGHMGLVGPGLNGGTYATTVVVGTNGTLPNWQASTAYTLNTIIKPTTNNAGNFWFRATTAGTSGSTEPTFPQTVGGTVTDGSVIWTNIGTSYGEGIDYTVDYVNGLIYVKTGGAISAGESLSVSYSYCDPTKVQDTDLIGSVTNGVYTGMQLFQLAFATFGFKPRILLAPGYNGNVGSKDLTVAAALTSLANQLPAIALVDSAPNTPVATAIANRSNPSSPFDTASYRVGLCFPNEQFVDEGYVPTGTTINNAGAVVNQISGAVSDSPYSSWVAGAWSAKILSSGFWTSPSNTPIVGPVGPDVAMYMSAFDPNSDTNNLNAQGIITVFNGYGTGLRVWGNRSSAFPTYTDPVTFLSVRMALDIIEEGIRQTSLQFLDQPITAGLINGILGSAQAFLNSQIQQGALVSGSNIVFNPSDNPASSLAAGVLVFELNLIPPPPAEKISYNFVINTNLLNNVTNAVSQS
jgi:phage tail sheath protein FI